MHGRILFNPKQFGRLALLGVVMAMSACGGGDSAGTTSPTAVLGANEVAPVSGQTVATTLASQTVDSTGAIIKTLEIELSIPSGALQQPTKITIEKLSEIPPEYSSWLSPSARVYKLSPEGTKFNSDITLKIYSPLVENDDDKIGILWSASGQPINIVPYVRDGNYLVAKSNHFSFGSALENNLILRTAWNIAKKAGAVASADAEIAGKVFYAIGAVEMATLCTFQGRGGVGQSPCSGPKQEDGTYDPLCFGSAYSGVDGDLSINPRTNLCWKPVKPTLSLLTSSLQMVGNGRLDAKVNIEHANSFKVVQAPLNGTLLPIDIDGSFTYLPNQNFVGSDSFSFVAVNEMGASAQAAISVQVSAALLRLVIDPSDRTLAAGKTTGLFVEAFDQNNNMIPTPPKLTWSVSDQAIAKVDSLGFVLGLAPGVVKVTATDPSSQKSASANITVGFDPAGFYVGTYTGCNSFDCVINGAFSMTISKDGAVSVVIPTSKTNAQEVGNLNGLAFSSVRSGWPEVSGPCGFISWSGSVKPSTAQINGNWSTLRGNFGCSGTFVADRQP